MFARLIDQSNRGTNMHLIDPNNYYLNDVFGDFLDASDELPEDNHFVYIENFDLSKNIVIVPNFVKNIYNFQC